MDEGQLPGASHVFHLTHVTGTVDEGLELGQRRWMAKREARSLNLVFMRLSSAH